MLFLEKIMSHNNQPLPVPGKPSSGRGKTIFQIACLAIPAALYLASGNPAFVVVFLGGMLGVSTHNARSRGR
jgi:hypothetical protein